MASKPRPRLVDLPLARRLIDCEPTQANISWALSIHQRAELLLARAKEAGAGEPSRNDLVAAIVLDAPTSGDQLKDLLDRYYLALVHDALSELVDIQENQTRVRVRKRPPGRPPKRRTA